MNKEIFLVWLLEKCSMVEVSFQIYIKNKGKVDFPTIGIW